MEYFLEPKKVEYACSCGILNPLTKLYFCRHCLQIRCPSCVHHEVDSHFCSNCLENIPSSEAKLKKNRCNSCFDCPSCQHTLSSRAVFVQVPMNSKPDDATKDVNESKQTKEVDASPKIVTKKMYYLACLACRWTTRDAGIPDQGSATSSWPEQEYGHANRFSLLMNHYQTVVLHDKQEKQDYLRRKTQRGHKFPSMTDRLGLTASSIRRSIGWTDKSVPKSKSRPTEIAPSVASDDVEELPEEIFTNEIKLKSITSIKQRLNQPANQPDKVNNLFPIHKSLTIKRTLRCRQCEHNVIKPEYNPTSIKYRIQLFASFHVPEVRFVEVTPIYIDKNSYVTLKIVNPTIHDMSITIMNLPTHDEEQLMIDDIRKNFEKTVNIVSKSSLTPSIMRTSLIEDPRIVGKKCTGDIELPDTSFIINQRDESAEFDDDIQCERQDPAFIVWRKANKVAIRIKIMPHKNLKNGEDVIIGFSLQYTYVHSTNAEKKTEPQKLALTSRIYISAGQFIENSIVENV